MPDGLVSQIPSLYYDLIARVLAGAPFALLIVWELRCYVEVGSDFPLTGTLLILVLLVGSYLIGLLLTPLCACLSVPVRIAMRPKLSTMKYGPRDSDGTDQSRRDANKGSTEKSRWNVIQASENISQWMDQIGFQHADAGATLAKMQAEAVLCQNLLGGFALVLVAHSYGLVLEGCEIGWWRAVFLIAVLAIALCQRNVAFLYRLEGYKLCLAPLDQSKSGPSI